MRAKITLAIGLLAFTPATCWLVACSSDGGTKDAGPDSSVADTGDTDTGVADTGVKDTGVDSGPNCAALDAGACQTCCANVNPMGPLFFQGAIYQCVCTGNKCPSCANNYCAAEAGLPSMPCGACAYATLEADGGACFGPVGMACAGNPQCLAWFACQAKCK